MVENLIIIGSGPAGYTAALYTAREDFKPLMISGTTSGGQLMLTSMVDNYPGFPDGIMGPELMVLFKKQAERFGTRFVEDEVIDVDFTKRPFTVKTSSMEYKAHTIIISTGASAKWLGLESEQRLMGKGVSSCATCDAPFFRNKDVVVVGGGDTAMEDSLFLTKFVKSVTLIHRRESFRASKIMQEKVLSNPKIKVMYETGIEEVLGDQKVSGVRVKNLKSGETSTISTDGLFVAIGHTPNTGFLKGKLEMDEHGYLVTKGEVKTDIDGVFVAGDVADRLYKQAVTAAGSGTKAALEVRAYLQKMNLDTLQ
ncbi:MAG TPA: thioredoxin-disulfide reductase [Candidatus Baltobacteraceae bacterium]|nr:thioredoxin-disulfide reductase [Candidatus Baltobacteraceae bacterium]